MNIRERAFRLSFFSRRNYLFVIQNARVHEITKRFYCFAECLLPLRLTNRSFCLIHFAVWEAKKEDDGLN